MQLFSLCTLFVRSENLQEIMLHDGRFSHTVAFAILQCQEIAIIAEPVGYFTSTTFVVANFFAAFYFSMFNFTMLFCNNCGLLVDVQLELT